ncbi:hypothetical protein V3595_22065 [Bacillus sp. CFBP9009]
MTVLLSVLVKPNPETGITPYLLMGSDSLRINVDVDANDNLFNEIRIENERKVFRVNDKLVSMSGRVDPKFYDGFIEFIRKNDCEITQLADLTLNHIKQHMSEKESNEGAKFVALIGSCTDANPRLFSIRADKNNLGQAAVMPMYLDGYGRIGQYPAGSIDFNKDIDLLETFKERVGDNFDVTNVEQAAREYLSSAASRYPKTCNQKINIEILS